MIQTNTHSLTLKYGQSLRYNDCFSSVGSCQHNLLFSSQVTKHQQFLCCSTRNTSFSKIIIPSTRESFSKIITPSRRTTTCLSTKMETEYNEGPSVAALERKLVTLRQITEIRRPCKLRFKRMMVVTVSGGWNVVIRKRHFKVGDHVLFFEPDSFIPISTFNFGRKMRSLLKEFNGEIGYHVQPRMICKHMSQGHVMAVEDFRFILHIVNTMKEEYGLEEGLRLASMMAFEGVIAVKRWEAPNEPNTA